MKISDFCITDNDIPKVIADRIDLYHKQPLERAEGNICFEIKVSLNSGWRPYLYEISRGRNGLSEHTFGQRRFKIIDEKGACDITCDDFTNNKDVLLQALIDNTDYIRFAVYKTFIHADYKDLQNGKRRLFKVPNTTWVFDKFI